MGQGPPRVGTLVSVNVGMPKDVPWQGKTVFTGVFKDPVDGPRRVGRLNVEGDGQGDLAGHGGEQRAVLVYQLDSYRHWEHELGRDDFVHGQFGENFTVDGLSDDEVCIGDRYRIGTAVFEVTQPRVTCYRVGIRLDDPRIPALLVSHRRPGFYLRVLEEGEVQAGDEILELARGPERMTVAEADALLYLPGHPRRQLLRALRIPALSPGWQESFRALLDAGPGAGNAGLVVASPPPAWPGFRPLAVTDIERESDSVISIRLEDPDGAPLPAARPGQFLTVRVPLRRRAAAAAPELLPLRPARRRLLPDRRQARARRRRERLPPRAPPRRRPARDRRAARHLRPRRDRRARPARQRRRRRHPGPRHAPRARRGAFREEIWWLHGARSGRDHSFAAEARALLASLPNARTTSATAARTRTTSRAATSTPRAGSPRRCSPGSSLRATPRRTSAARRGSWRRSAPASPRSASTPPTSTPSRSGRPPGSLPGSRRPRHGRRTARGRPRERPDGRVRAQQPRRPWSDDFGSLLELAEACDVPVRWSCRTGVCHNCETTLVAGAVDYDPDPVEPPAEGSALICCSRPHDDLVLDL